MTYDLSGIACNSGLRTKFFKDLCPRLECVSTISAAGVMTYRVRRETGYYGRRTMHGDCQTSASRIALFVTSVSGFTLASMVRLNVVKPTFDFLQAVLSAASTVNRASSLVVCRR